MIRLHAILIIFILLMSCNNKDKKSEATSSDAYIVVDEYNLSLKTNGVDGKLQILMDKAIPSNLHIDSPLDYVKYHFALLHVIDQSNNVLTSLNLNHLCASFNRADNIEATPTWFALTTEHVTEYPSYDSSWTTFFRIKNSKIEWLSVVDKLTSEISNIELIRSRKSDWRLKRSSKSDSIVILSVVCRVNFKDMRPINSCIPRETIYSRFYFNGDHLECVMKIEDGSWNNEDSTSFPDFSKFNF